MDTQFWTRFTLVTFGGAAVGLVIGVIGRYVFGADWNIFGAAAWGIMAGAVGLSFVYVHKGVTDAKKGGSEGKPDAG